MTDTVHTASTSIPADETPLECIHRSCQQLEQLHGITTLAGSRARVLIKDILQAAGQLNTAADITADLLMEALADLQAANDDPDGA